MRSISSAQNRRKSPRHLSNEKTHQVILRAPPRSQWYPFQSMETSGTPSTGVTPKMTLIFPDDTINLGSQTQWYRGEKGSDESASSSHSYGPLGAPFSVVVAFEGFSWPILVAFRCWPLPVLGPPVSVEGCASTHRRQPRQVWRGARCASRTLTRL